MAYPRSHESHSSIHSSRSPVPQMTQLYVSSACEHKEKQITHTVVSITGRVRRAALHTCIPIYQRWIPVPLITADLFRRVVLSQVMRPRGRGFDSRSVTFPPPGFDTHNTRQTPSHTDTDERTHTQTHKHTNTERPTATAQRPRNSRSRPSVNRKRNETNIRLKVP